MVRRLPYIEENTIIIGDRKESTFSKDIASVCIIIALRTDEIYKLLFVLSEYIETVTLPINQQPKFKGDEELFTYFLYKYFKLFFIINMKTYIKVSGIIIVILISLILLKFVHIIVGISFFIIGIGLLVYYGFIKKNSNNNYVEFKKPNVKLIDEFITIYCNNIFNINKTNRDKNVLIFKIIFLRMN